MERTYEVGKSGAGKCQPSKAVYVPRSTQDYTTTSTASVIRDRLQPIIKRLYDQQRRTFLFLSILYIL